MKSKVALCLLAVSSEAALFRGKNSSALEQNTAQTPPAFETWYANHDSGRGIWKWNDALAAYQTHFAPYAGQKLKLVEVGVQSGGSAEMWKGVLGPGLHYYGLDINKNCKSFEDSSTTITLGDQADPAMWNGFFSTVVNQVDFIVDDGGHQPHQMLTTFQAGFPKVRPGGYSVIEDVFGESFVPSLLYPCADSIGSWLQYVAAAHIYPGIFMVQKAGGWMPNERMPATTFENTHAFWASVPAHAGQRVAIKNEHWGNMLDANNLKTILKEFSGLYNNAIVVDQPQGCSTTSAAVCTTSIKNSYEQSVITGVHVYPSQVLVDVAMVPPAISAARRGTEWIEYR